jgi:hypothetical protein
MPPDNVLHRPRGGQDVGAPVPSSSNSPPQPEQDVAMNTSGPPDQPSHPASQYGYDDLDEWPSDDFDSSDDGGAPLVNYLDIANLLNTDVDMEPPIAPDETYDISNDDTDSSEQEGEPSGPVMPWTHGLPSSLAGPDFSNMDAVDGIPSSAGGLGLVPEHGNEFFGMLSHAEAVFTSIAESAAVVQATEHTIMQPASFATLPPANPGLEQFLRLWAYARPNRLPYGRDRAGYPWMGPVQQLLEKEIHQVRYADLRGDYHDMQGIDWRRMDVTRTEARERRLDQYKNYVNKPSSDAWRVSEWLRRRRPRDEFLG